MPDQFLTVAAFFAPGVILGLLTALLCAPLARANFFLGALAGLLAMGCLAAFAAWKTVQFIRAEQAACEAEQAASAGAGLLDCKALGLWAVFPVSNAAAALVVFLIGVAIAALRR